MFSFVFNKLKQQILLCLNDFSTILYNIKVTCCSKKYVYHNFMQNYLGYYYASLVVITIDTRYKYILLFVQQNSFNAALHLLFKAFFKVLYYYIYIFIT